MRAALGLARRGLGQTWPNPTVGCVLVRDGLVVGRGRTGDGGRPHAEAVALAQAGEAARGATAYVTLEPCSHYGKTPPCAEALVQAGVVRCVVALGDPDPRVDGGGLKRLRAAGVEVVTGVAEAEAAEVNAGFLMRVRAGRPLVTLKIASSLDGRIATGSGESRWISGDAARAVVHRMRADSDAVLIGSGTGMVDNPDLTCRLPGLAARSPIRIVVDGHLRLPLTTRLVATARIVPTWILTRTDADPERADIFRECGVDVIEIAAGADGKIDLAGAMRVLGERGLTRVLVEAGGHLAAALFRCGLTDRLAWVHAPVVLGGDAQAAAVSFGVDRLAQAPRFRRLRSDTVGVDLVEIMTNERE